MRQFRFAAPWAILALLLLIALATTLNVLAATFLMIPLVMLYARLPLRGFLAVFAAILLILAGIMGAASPVLLTAAVFFAIPSAVMGHRYKKLAAASSVLFAGMLVIFLELVAILLLGALLGYNLPQILAGYARSVYASPMLAGLLTPDEQDQNIQQMLELIPLFMLIFSLYYAGISHAVCRRLLRRNGMKVPAMKPMKDWHLPKSLVWYYLASLVLDLFVPGTAGSTWEALLVNVVPLFMMIFAVQGIGFLFFLADCRRWNRWLPILGWVLFPFLMNVISILGLFDTAFPVRDRLKKP